MEKNLCSEIQPLPRPLQANSTKSPPLPLVSHSLYWRENRHFPVSQILTKSCLPIGLNKVNFGLFKKLRPNF
jgi:hypothetical protein